MELLCSYEVQFWIFRSVKAFFGPKFEKTLKIHTVAILQSISGNSMALNRKNSSEIHFGKSWGGGTPPQKIFFEKKIEFGVVFD